MAELLGAIQTSEMELSERVDSVTEHRAAGRRWHLATSDDLQGLVAQGRTMAEAMEITQDVARKLIESYLEHSDSLPPHQGQNPRGHHS